MCAMCEDMVSVSMGTHVCLCVPSHSCKLHGSLPGLHHKLIVAVGVSPPIKSLFLDLTSSTLTVALTAAALEMPRKEGQDLLLLDKLA